MVIAYRELVSLWYQRAEAATGGYVADLMTYVQSFPRPALRDFMISYYREEKASATQDGPAEQADTSAEG
jgi:hypothetical protein